MTEIELVTEFVNFNFDIFFTTFNVLCSMFYSIKKDFDVLVTEKVTLYYLTTK